MDAAIVDMSIENAADGASTSDVGSDPPDASDATDAASDTPQDAATADTSDAGGTSDVITGCNATTCPTGCCNASNQCVTTPTPAACGGGGAMCQACAAGQECSGTSCVCTPSSCANGCCDNMQRCIPYAGQIDTICGTGGLACSSCGSGKYCNGSGGCNTANWCRMQTVPSGVDLADYQCVDFDTGVLPPAWTLTQAAGGTGQISTTQASSTPYSFYSTSIPPADTVGTLNWSHVGTTPVTQVNLAVDVFRVSVIGDPGPWSGYIEELCAAIGNIRACYYFAGAAGFGVAFWNGTNRVDCGPVTDLRKGLWTRLDLQIGSSGPIYLSYDGSLVSSCNVTGSGFPSSTVGAATIGLARTGMALELETYFDNAVVIVRR